MGIIETVYVGSVVGREVTVMVGLLQSLNARTDFSPYGECFSDRRGTALLLRGRPEKEIKTTKKKFRAFIF